MCRSAINVTFCEKGHLAPGGYLQSCSANSLVSGQIFTVDKYYRDIGVNLCQAHGCPPPMVNSGTVSGDQRFSLWILYRCRGNFFPAVNIFPAIRRAVIFDVDFVINVVRRLRTVTAWIVYQQYTHTFTYTHRGHSSVT